MKKILVLGHVDHGKTTFIRALNNVLYTRYGIGNEAELVPEKVVTSKNSFPFSLGGVNFQYTDYPGFVDYLNIFEAGNEKFDGALMICAATDGPMPETTKLARMAKESGIEKLVAFLNKTDMVSDEELLSIVRFELENTLIEEGYPESIDVILGSAEEAMMHPESADGDKILATIQAMAKLFSES